MTNDRRSVRLNKFLALELGISRRAADTLIEQGKVTVNDKIVGLGARAAEEATIKVNGVAVKKDATYLYLVLHKPVGYVCSRRPQGDSPTIYELLPVKYHILKPVGRLDKDSSGLILLTNDGDFAHQMTHPKFYKTKIYEVALDKPLEPLHQQMISDYGIMLEDGPSKFVVEKIDDQPTTATNYRITMHEGRNRQIRRTFSALGYTIRTLHRTQFGPYELAQIRPGQYHLLSQN